MKNHQHSEAFCLMTYMSDDGTEVERIWNSRDGVTPFSITLKSGKQAMHVDWQNDIYCPDYKPPKGSRIFVDLTEERAREIVKRNADDYWDNDIAGARGAFGSKEALHEALLQDMLSAWREGAPDIKEVE